ncbi:hypothetical protein LEP1GSC193_3258 [Leptospira alstonii serovar Pingchang str. 80-412]|uniref:Uncharacterized protein n=2 Tax=Leptospira alstonii TaxID=28452 RepID=M6D141_9LEPT|nr:hypothetical protein LEP1GSC194_3037 [Leptospira alstonii serovar Sichuan str. 79601]EQA79303.1 hypothetical protein LEP1GSC193_3258 [Leptospira alstonii serovar Pingchang str. 80-412]
MYGGFQIVHGFFRVQDFSLSKQRDRKKIERVNSRISDLPFAVNSRSFHF